jgi:hypothetical protein
MKINARANQKSNIEIKSSFFKFFGIELIPTINHIVRTIKKKLMHFIVNKGLENGKSLSCLFANFKLILKNITKEIKGYY